MTTFLTCRSCVDRRNCSIQNAIRRAIKGLHVTTIRHTCKEHRLPFEPGQAVWAYVQEHPYEWDQGSEPQKAWFPGFFVDVSSKSNVNGLVFIETEAPSRHDAHRVFLPLKEDEKGAVCKLPWSRIQARDAMPLAVCNRCGQIEGMKCEGPEIWGRGDRCPLAPEEGMVG